MHCTRTDEFCTIERTPTLVRLRLRHALSLPPGQHHLAREVACRINEARALKPGQLYSQK
jgi:hypothetical protein